MTIEVKNKRKIGEKFTGFVAPKYVGQAGIIQREYVDGPNDIVAGGSWYCSRPS